MAQQILDGTYHDKSGNEFTGAEAIIRGLIVNLTDPKGKNWGKAMDLMVQLTGANLTKEQKQKIKVETEMLKAKTSQLKKEEKHNGLLANLIEGLKEDDLYSETATSDETMADEQIEKN